MDDERDWNEANFIPLGMALIAAVAGLAFYHLIGSSAFRNEMIPLWRQPAAVFVGVSTISFLITLDRVRWWWSVIFALAWGTVMAFVGWWTASYNFVPNIFEFPFLSGIAAVLVAAPLFQAARDEGAARFPIDRVHRHVWSDVVIGLFALLFTGLCFIVAYLIATLFNIIGITALKELFREGWFGWMLAGAAFGGAVGIMREREALLDTVRKLVMAILAVLAPVVAVALWCFFLALPFTGLEKFWDSGIPPTPILLLGAFGAFALTNVIIGDGTEGRKPSKLMHYVAMALAAAILPLALLAAMSMNQRIVQYGWTPERLWGVIAVGVALVTGGMFLWSLIKDRWNFAEIVRPLQIKVALGVVGIAMFLALPILDFGSISAKSQIARLEAGKVKPADFDWRAMAFDFGSAGRKALAELEHSPNATFVSLAQRALAAKDSWALDNPDYSAAKGQTSLVVVPNKWPIPDDLKILLMGSGQSDTGFCNQVGECRVYVQDGGRSVVVLMDQCASLPVDVRASPNMNCAINPAAFELRDGKWLKIYENGDRIVSDARPGMTKEQEDDSLQREREALARGDVRIGEVTHRQIFIDGKPVGGPFE